MSCKLIAIWCEGCQQRVKPGAWNQDLYLCTRCADQLRHAIRLWATGRLNKHVPISAVLARSGRKGIAG